MFTRLLMRNFKLSTQSYYDKFRMFEVALINRNCFFDTLNKSYSFQTNTNDVEHRKKISLVPKITLLSGNDLTITTLEEAQKLAKRRDLNLVRIVDIDTKTNRPVYKLMTGAEYHEEDLKQRERKKAEKLKSSFKGEKVLIVGQNISQHDLEVHCSKTIKWLDKKYEVRIVINGDAENMKKAVSKVLNTAYEVYIGKIK